MTGKQKTAGGQRQAAAAMALDGASAAEAVVVLPADCRIAVQAMVKDALIGTLAAGNAMLDGRGVEHVDTAALQLLMLFQRELKARGGTLGWRGASDALNNAAGLLGLSRTLGLPATAPAR